MVFQAEEKQGQRLGDEREQSPLNELLKCLGHLDLRL